MTIFTPKHYRRALVAGLVAGAAATLAKSKAEEQLQPLAEKALPPSAAQRTEVGADPAGHPENMPPSELADQAVHAVTGGQLSDDQREQASNYLHWAMGLGFGVTYAIVAERLPIVRAGRGVAAGVVLFGATHATGLPAAGFQHPPTQLPRAWWIWEGGSHLVYGAALDGAMQVTRAALDRISR